MTRKPLLTLMAMAALATASTASAARPDAWITTKTKLALLTDPDVSGLRINVDTQRSVVTLHGNVSSQAEADKAVSVARGIEGVTDVHSMLNVKPDTSYKSDTTSTMGAKADTMATKTGNAASNTANKVKTAVSNEKIEMDVKSKLAGDKSLDNSKIHVKDADNGVVVLTGTAASMGDERRAIMLAREVKGVDSVRVEDLTISDDNETDQWQERKMADGKVVSTAGDMWITSAVKLRLLANGDTPGTAINVDTDRGVVTLFGMVPNDKAKTQAELEAKQVNDVRKVVNELEVVPKDMKDSVVAKDEDIKDQVQKAIKDDTSLDHADVDVAVKNGVVRLTGTVGSIGEKLSAATDARMIPGVKSVHQELKITSRTSAQK
jgi:osmotically-inducible protein OsmY